MTLFESALESFGKASSLVKKVMPFLNKGKKADVELPQGIEDMMRSVLNGNDAVSEPEGEAVADIPMDDALATEQDEMEVVLPGEDAAEGAESADEAPVKGKQKKEKPAKVKKEKPARVKKEKPPRVKKTKPAKGQPEEGAEDAESEDIADSADSVDSTDSSDGAEETKVKKSKSTGGKKLIPLVAVAVIILLLIPGNVLFVMNFLSGNDSGNENEPPPQIVVPTPDVNDEPDEDLPDEDEPDTDDTSDEDDPDDNQNGDSNGDTDDDNQPQAETNIARLMGRRTSHIKEVFGEPDSEKLEDGIIVWSYGTNVNASLIIKIYNDRSFQLTLLDDEYSIFGIEHGENIIDARAHLIVNLGFIFTGDVVVDEVTHMTFMNLYNSITVMVELVAAEDGTVAELIFTDMDVAQVAGA